MKKFTIIICLLIGASYAETFMGSLYLVSRDSSHYSAEEGDRSITIMPKGTIVRLIKDETLAEALVLSPLRIIKLMVSIEPRGNWLIEDDKGNRGYMWDSDLELYKKR